MYCSKSIKGWVRGTCSVYPLLPDLVGGCSISTVRPGLILSVHSSREGVVYVLRMIFIFVVFCKHQPLSTEVIASGKTVYLRRGISVPSATHRHNRRQHRPLDLAKGTCSLSLPLRNSRFTHLTPSSFPFLELYPPSSCIFLAREWARGLQLRLLVACRGHRLSLQCVSQGRSWGGFDLSSSPPRLIVFLSS